MAGAGVDRSCAGLSTSTRMQPEAAGQPPWPDSAPYRVSERLRDPAVQESARRTAGRLAAAVSASADAVGPGTRRGAGGAGEPDQTSRSGTAG